MGLAYESILDSSAELFTSSLKIAGELTIQELI